MPNFYLEVTVTDVASYPTTPQAILGFVPSSITITAETNQIAFSFDGKNDHGVIEGGKSYTSESKLTKIWFREGTGVENGASLLRVQAETV